MIKINTKLFDLNEVFTTMTHSSAWDLAITLKDIKLDLRHARATLAQYDENVFEVMAIDEQISFIDKNIKTVEEALMCFESKIFERRMKLKDLQTVCLN